MAERFRASIDVTSAWHATGQAERLDHGGLDATYTVSEVAPLLALLRAIRPRSIAIAGPAGAGKTTLVAALAQQLRSRDGQHALAVSLDDFYLPKAERDALGFRFRAVPGTHDVDAVEELLTAAHDRVVPLVVPRFDARIDDCGEPVLLTEPVDLVLIDGWFLGLEQSSYGRLVEQFDLIVHLRIPADLARARRFARERTLQRAGRGLSPQLMEQFWNEVLGPGGESWVAEAAANAHLLLDFDADGRLNRVLASPDISAALRCADVDSSLP